MFSFFLPSQQHRALALAVLCGVLGTNGMSAAELSKYRGFQFGMDLLAAVQQAGSTPAEVRTVQQRPAVIQELEWRASGLEQDSLKDGLLSFYQGKLFQIVATYDRDRVEGMTADDMVAGISATYGLASTPKEEDVAYRSNYGERGSVLARWEDRDYSYNLVRSGYGDSYALVMYSKRLYALAATSITEAARLDVLEAPARALDAKKKQINDDRVTLERARTVNAPKFRP